MARYRYPRGGTKGGLRNQILSDHQAYNAVEFNTFKFTELEHRSNDVVLVRIDTHFGWSTTAEDDDVECQLALVSKPEALGAPVVGDMLNERYTILPKTCLAGGFTGRMFMDHLHTREKLKIRVPLNNDVYITVANKSATALGVAAWIVRLFWTLL